VAAIIDAHAGTVNLDTGPGQGCRATVSLPLEVTTRARTRPEAAAPTHAGVAGSPTARR
jgi:hypothetical protein